MVSTSSSRGPIGPSDKDEKGPRYDIDSAKAGELFGLAADLSRADKRFHASFPEIAHRLDCAVKAGQMEEGLIDFAQRHPLLRAAIDEVVTKRLAEGGAVEMEEIHESMGRTLRGWFQMDQQARQAIVSEVPSIDVDKIASIFAADKTTCSEIFLALGGEGTSYADILARI